jgi:hypothetical protein
VAISRLDQLTGTLCRRTAFSSFGVMIARGYLSDFDAQRAAAILGSIRDEDLRRHSCHGFQKTVRGGEDRELVERVLLRSDLQSHCR